MQPVEIYFAFQKPASFRDGLRDIPTLLGHVEAFGYTVDDTWFFLDPNRKVAHLRITHHHDDVERIMAEIIARSYLVLRVEPGRELRFPPVQVYSCAAVCAHLVGLRAFTPRGLIRKLRAINATEVKNEDAEDAQGGQGRQSRACARAPHVAP